MAFFFTVRTKIRQAAPLLFARRTRNYPKSRDLNPPRSPYRLHPAVCCPFLPAMKLVNVR
jgi:hypothetical protein